MKTKFSNILTVSAALFLPFYCIIFTTKFRTRVRWLDELFKCYQRKFALLGSVMPLCCSYAVHFVGKTSYRNGYLRMTGNAPMKLHKARAGGDFNASGNQGQQYTHSAGWVGLVGSSQVSWLAADWRLTLVDVRLFGGACAVRSARASRMSTELKKAHEDRSGSGWRSVVWRGCGCSTSKTIPSLYIFKSLSNWAARLVTFCKATMSSSDFQHGEDDTVLRAAGVEEETARSKQNSKQL